VTTNYDPEGRSTIFDQLPDDLPRVVTVGRLDIGTTGLLLLTNDGHLSRVLEHPQTEWPRCYRVRAYGHITQDTLDGLKKGVTVDGIDYGPIEAILDREVGDNVWLTMTLHEGKNREIKVVLGSLGLVVNRLIRTSFGPFILGDLAENTVIEVPDCLSVTQIVDGLKRYGEQIRESSDGEISCEEESLDAESGQNRKSLRSSSRSGDGSLPLKRRKHSFQAREKESIGPQRYIWRATDEDASEVGRESEKTPQEKLFLKRKKASRKAGKNVTESHKRLGRIKTRKGESVLVEKTIRS
jgi:23S rRNA pseudouridine2605 synthase